MIKDEQKQLCHPELVSGSCKSVGEKILNRVQNDNVPEARQHGSKRAAFTLAEVPEARQCGSKRAAFTLAEVLITLGIIGIVAAMTIPTLTKSYEKKVTETKVKQSFSMLAQAIKMSVAENGEMSDWDFGQNSITSMETFMNTYILPYLKTISYCDKKGTGKSIVLPCKGTPISTVSVEYILSNGVTASFKPLSDKRIVVLLNTNINNNSSNTPGKDWFYFYIKNDVVEPFGYKKGITREDALNGYNSPYSSGKTVACKSVRNSASNRDRHACTLLFYIDGMRFAPDYPW